MKSKEEMDLQEWELVPDDDGEGFLEIISTYGGRGSNIYSSPSFSNTRTTVPHMNYFHYSYCPPPPTPPPPEFVRKTPQVPIDLKMSTMMMMPPPPLAEAGGGSERNTSIEQDPVSSPKYRSGMMVKMLDHQNEDLNQFDPPPPPPCKQVDVVVDSEMDLDKGTSDGEKQGGGGGQGLLKIWKWSINVVNNGIGGAICSFAAICCIISLRSCSNNNIKHQRKLQHHFQIYTTTKDHKQVVHHANEAISTVIRGGRGGGVPIITTAARITFGGYYDAASSL